MIDASEHKQAYALVESWRRDDRRCYVTWNIVYEFLRVSAHHTVVNPLDSETA